MLKQNKILFFETPKDKLRVFQEPRLVMFSENNEVGSWENTQPLYFYPFSWLDYLGKNKVRELFIQDCFSEIAEKEIKLLDSGKVHFEKPDIQLMRIAKERGHKVSVICNLENLTQEQIEGLSDSDFVKVRVGKDYSKLSLLSNLPNEQVLSCIKAYVGEGCDYQNLALQAREIGFDFIHVAKRLANNTENPKLLRGEREKIMRLQELETKQFRIIIPSSLEERFARRFVITLRLGNVSSCDFSRYRFVLKGDNFYPCYTQQILAQEGFRKEKLGLSENNKNCLDCACVYENDMLFDMKDKMKSYKNTSFALEYIENGK